jgi:hypothetical protein
MPEKGLRQQRRYPKNPFISFFNSFQLLTPNSCTAQRQFPAQAQMRPTAKTKSGPASLRPNFPQRIEAGSIRAKHRRVKVGAAYVQSSYLACLKTDSSYFDWITGLPEERRQHRMKPQGFGGSLPQKIQILQPWGKFRPEFQELP